MSAPARDWTLGSGERQTSPLFSDANAAHRARYAWAAQLLGTRTGQHGADVFCASGYGTLFLAEQTGATVLGIDGCEDAVQVALIAAGAREDVAFQFRRYPCPLPVDAFRFVVSLESIEHVADDARFVEALAAMLVPGGDLLVSVPNEARISCAAFRNPFHVRHYAPEAFAALMEGAGLELVAHYAQHIHAYVDTAWGVQRRGRIPDAEQSVRLDPAWSSNPCALLAHYRATDRRPA